MAKDLLILFDLDGTLWDSAQAVAESWNEVFRRTDPALPTLTAEDIHRVMGLTTASGDTWRPSFTAPAWLTCFVTTRNGRGPA